MEPREFFIEDRLERFRFSANCNLGESGLRNFSVKEIIEKNGIEIQELLDLSLADSPNQGMLALREEIASLYGGRIGAENILITTGTSEALYIFFHLTLKPGDRFSYIFPAFQALYEIPLMLGAKQNPVLPVEDRLEVSRLWENDPKLVILNHPHNPTGYGLLPEDWNWMEENVAKKESLVLFDEHYRFLDYNQDLTRTGIHLGENAFATGSITKCFGVVGLKIGWLVGDSNLIQRARSFKDYLTHTVNPISEFLAYKILLNRVEFLTPIRERILSNIRFFEENLSGLPCIIEYKRPSGGLVCFLKIQEDLSSEKYADQLFQEASVFLLPGSNFEREGYLRIGFGEETSRFRNGILRWVEFEKKRC